MKSEIAYANSKGIEVGGYDLIVLTRGGVPDYYHADGGQGTCIASSWSVAVRHSSVELMIITTLIRELYCLKCFNTVGWVAGRASGL